VVVMSDDWAGRGLGCSYGVDWESDNFCFIVAT
jgi:hypothetical protein